MLCSWRQRRLNCLLCQTWAGRADLQVVRGRVEIHVTMRAVALPSTPTNTAGAADEASLWSQEDAQTTVPLPPLYE